MFDNMEMLLGIRLASLALGLGGVFFASHMLLTTWIAVRSLTPAPEKQDTDRALARAFSRLAGERGLIWAISLYFFVVIGGYVFLVFILPRIASQGVMDMVIGVIMWAFLSIVFDSAILCWPSIASSVRLTRSIASEDIYEHRFEYPNTRFHKIRPFISAGLAIMMLVAANHGLQGGLPPGYASYHVGHGFHLD